VRLPAGDGGVGYPQAHHGGNHRHRIIARAEMVSQVAAGAGAAGGSRNAAEPVEDALAAETVEGCAAFAIGNRRYLPGAVLLPERGLDLVFTLAHYFAYYHSLSG